LSTFANRLIRWQRRHGRHDLPWQRTRDPYRIWLSEVMLQQTRVATVIPYYERFLARFPDVVSLARASLEEVLTLWSGLGYYSRARNLHAAAAMVVGPLGGRFPRRREAIETLPGVGRSTAAAIAVFASGAREAILDGNVKRVLARHFALRGVPGEKRTENRLWKIAESLLPSRDIRSYTQALMDLGADLCSRSRPACGKCPLKKSCRANAGGNAAAYPRPRPRKALPARTTSMLLLLRGGEVLLEKRPPAGIWGGLWCFPEIPAGEDARDYCLRRWGTRLAAVARLPPVRHGFTHFTLNIVPVVCRASLASSLVSEPGQVSLPLEDAAEAAVPAPVRKLLSGLSPQVSADVP
jgi:A/G-specific adenine glycosylase